MKVIKNYKEISGNGSHPKAGFSLKARELFASSGSWMSKHDAIEKGVESLLADRDELIEYVKALKALAIYLTNTTHIRPHQLSEEYFLRAEENFADYLRREIDVDVQSQADIG